MVTLVTSSSVVTAATCVTIVTFIAKFTKIPYGYCGTLLASLLRLLKLPMFLMVSTVLFAAMVIRITTVTYVPRLHWLLRCV
jgi:hypothetical protein